MSQIYEVIVKRTQYAKLYVSADDEAQAYSIAKDSEDMLDRYVDTCNQISPDDEWTLCSDSCVQAVDDDDLDMIYTEVLE